MYFGFPNIGIEETKPVVKPNPRQGSGTLLSKQPANAATRYIEQRRKTLLAFILDFMAGNNKKRPPKYKVLSHLQKNGYEVSGEVLDSDLKKLKLPKFFTRKS